MSEAEIEEEQQHKLQEAVLNSDVRLHRADIQQLLVSKKEIPPEQQEWSPSLDQEDPPELPHIKEEQEEHWTSQEGEQLRGLEEADIIKFTFTPVTVKSEEDDEEKSESATSFGHRGHLQKHNGIQSAVKSFSCSDCRKRYDLKNSLTTHVRLHSEGKRFSCSVCRLIAEYKEELCQQHKLLDAVFNPQVRLHRADIQLMLVSKEEVAPEKQDWSPSLDQEDPPELPHIREEQLQLWTSQEIEQLQGLQKADMTKFTLTPVPVKSEEDNEEKPQFSQLHQRQTEQIKTEADGEDCGGSEPAWNLNPDSHLQPATHDKMSHTKPETDDSCDWKETREPQSGLNPLQNNEVPVSDMECNTGKTSVSPSECATSFGHKRHLQSGIRTGVKPFSCSVCSKTYPQKNSVTTHMILHSEGKCFNCSVCRTIGEYKGKFCRHKLLDAVFNPEVQLHRADVQLLLVNKEEVPPEQQEWSPSLDQEDPPELPHIKEEQEELWTSQEGEQLQTLEEAGITKLTFILLPVKTEDHHEEKPQSSQLHQSQTEENRDAEHLKTEADGEDCGGSEPARNFDLDSHLQPDTHDKVSHSSESETDDSSCGWEETRKPQSSLCNTGETSLNSSKCTANNGNKGKLQEHKEIQTGVKKYRCYVCGNRFEDMSTLRQHLIVHTGEKPLNCSFCGKSFKHSGTLNRHVTVHTGERPFSCIICGRRFREKGKVKQHMTVHTGEKPFSCSVCCKKFAEHGNLKQHMTVHTGERPFNCSVCGKGFVVRGSLRRHTKTHGGNKMFSCSLCGKAFVLKEHLTLHLSVHTGKKPFNCNVCNGRFARKSHLRRHMSIHTGEKPFSCSVCGKRFAQKDHLKGHMTVHTGERPFSCSVCGKGFKEKGNLRQHMSVHTGEKPFSCSVCGRKFAQHVTLKHHMTVHTGEKPFSCSICSKKFAQHVTLKQHMTVHTGEKPFNCSVCGKAFAARGSLRRHTETHEGEKQINCSVYDERFAEKEHLKQHLTAHT